MKKIQCGGFYVDDEAIETRDGKPFLKTGGSDPIVENAKQTGGIGWTESGELEEIFTKDFVSELNQGIYGVQFENETGTTISVGNSYVVNFDGEEFHCIGVSAGDFNGVGNASLMPTGGDNTGEPFVAAFDEDFGMIITAEGGNHSITISAASDTVHKIDEKYLPEAGGGTMIVNFELNDGEYVADKTFNEILNAFPNVQGSYFHGEVIYHVQENDGDYAISFMSLNTSSTKLLVDQFIIDSDNSIERIEKSVSFNSETPS